MSQFEKAVSCQMSNFCERLVLTRQRSTLFWSVWLLTSKEFEKNGR